MNSSKKNRNRYTKARKLLLGFAFVCMLTPMLSAAGMYRWVDSNGRVHYGDSVPAEYTKYKTDILNPQGVVVRTLAAQKTQSELKEEAKERARIKELKRLAALEAQRNRIILASYISTDEIDATRDKKVSTIKKRLELLELNSKNLLQQQKTIEGRIVANQNSTDNDDREDTLARLHKQLVATNTNSADLDIQRSNLNLEIAEIGKRFAEEKKDFIRLVKEKEKQRNAENHPIY